MDARDEMNNQELISALADGQLAGEELARGVQVAAADARSREAWYAYHVVGEALRTGRAGAGMAPEAFLAKLQVRLREEAITAPQPAAQLQVVRTQHEAANDWRWKLVAGVASVAAVAAVGWNVWGTTASVNAQPQLAAAPAATPQMAEASMPMIRDPRLDQLLAAHRQLGGATAFAASSGFLRNATFEGPAR
jgi:sigma-E factor negative regulatory protein RseA